LLIFFLHKPCSTEWRKHFLSEFI